jgi:hypothetical protein
LIIKAITVTILSSIDNISTHTVEICTRGIKHIKLVILKINLILADIGDFIPSFLFLLLKVL